MPGERVFLRTNAVKTDFPQNEKKVFSNEKLNLTALSRVFRDRNRTYSDAFFPPASNGTIEMPGERVFLRTNAEIPFSLKMKNRYFPLNNLS